MTRLLTSHAPEPNNTMFLEFLKAGNHNEGSRDIHSVMLSVQNIYLRMSSWSWELWEKQHYVTFDHTIKREWGDEMCTEEQITSNGWKMRAVNTFLAGWRDRGREGEREGEWWLSWLVENWIRLIGGNLDSRQTWQPREGWAVRTQQYTYLCVLYCSLWVIFSLLIFCPQNSSLEQFRG